MKSKPTSARAPSSDPVQIPSRSSPVSLPRRFVSPKFLWFCLGLIALDIFVFAPVRHYDFVTWDDPDYVTNNRQVLSGVVWPALKWALTTGYAANWHPLTWVSLMLDAQMYGTTAAGYHLTNLLFHVANTLLLLGLLHWMTGALGRSAFVAALFAVHPLHVESVAWVSERKDVLSTLFWMLTLLAYVAYARKPGAARYMLVFLFYALGLMAKPMLVTLPFVLVLLDVWPLRRLALGIGAKSRAGSKFSGDFWSSGLRLLIEKLPLVGIAIASSIVTIVVQGKWGAVTGLDRFPLSLRAANALVSYMIYMGQMLWPARLAAFYPYPRSLSAGWVMGAMLFLVAVSAAAIREIHRRPFLTVGWLWYLGTLVPVIGLIQVGGQARADRYTYVALIGLFIVFAWGTTDLLARWRYRAVALSAAAVVVILACAITARAQVRYWDNAISLWEHTLQVTERNPLAHNDLGVALVAEGRVTEAIPHYYEALRFNPTYAEAQYNLGNALARLGKGPEAIPHYLEALRIRPAYAQVHNNLGTTLLTQGKLNEAIPHYEEALRIQPDYTEAHNNLGIALASEGRLPEAIAHFTEALRIQPDYADAHGNLQHALAEQGRVLRQN